MIGTLKNILALLCGLLPDGAIKRCFLNFIPGFSVSSSAHMGPVLLLGCEELVIHRDAKIAAFNVFRRLRHCEIHASAEVGSFNWFSSAPFLTLRNPFPGAGHLTLGADCSVTSRHYFDASGGIIIDEYATVAGVRSTLMSHGIDVRRNVMMTAPIHVGRHSMVGSNCKILPGASVPEMSVIAMGAVVKQGLTKPSSLYAGVPAQYKGPVAGAYFIRSNGPVPTRFDELS